MSTSAKGGGDSVRPDLWNIDHPYYCSESNYYASPANAPYQEYRSWAEFFGAEGDADLDMNLVFRWDWQRKDYCEDAAEELAYDAKYDDNYRAYTLQVFWMGQRKGIFRVTEADVCRADAEAIREWLTTRWEHLVTLWQPISPQVAP